MGLSSSLYIGPYMQCTKIETPYEIEQRSCWNPECVETGKRIWDKDKLFCSKCGSPIKNKIITKLGHQCHSSFEEMREEAKEHVISLGTDPEESHVILAPNISLKGITRKLFFNTRCDVLDLEITPSLIESELDIFKIEISKEIAIVEKYWGKENVTIKWGIRHEIN